MKDYGCFSDNEINEMVADLRGGCAGNVHGSETAVKVSDAATNGLFYMEVDYCNNPSDAWPVILESRISLRPDDMYEEAPHSGYWRADNEAGNHCHHENPLRAAMIVYLMMKDEEK